MSLIAGETIVGFADEYRCLQTHGEGGFAVAFAGERVSDDAPVILKELRIERLKDWKALELFEREAAALKTLSHARIPKYYDFFAWAGERPLAPSELQDCDGDLPSLILVQERLDGRTLADHIESRSRLSSAKVEILLRGLLDIAKYLHELHPPVIHRDVNPNNVLVDDDGLPSLVDFGGVQDRLRLSTKGSTQMGTFGYMPIEQISGAARPSSDLYAIGMTMLSAISHHPPHEMPVDEESSKVKVAELTAQLDPKLAAVLSGLVEPLAARRLASAAEALRQLDRGPGIGARRSILAALGVGVAAGLGALYFGASEPDVEAPRVEAPTESAPPSQQKKSKRTGPFRTEEEAGFKKLKAKTTWKARVKDSERLGLAQGTSCIIAAELETFFVSTRPDEDRARVLRLNIDCAGKSIYQFVATKQSNPYAAFILEEYPADVPGSFRHPLHWYDHSAMVHADIDTTENLAKVIRQRPEPSRIELFVEKLSAPVQGALYRSSKNRTVTAPASQQHSVTAVHVTGPAPVAVNDRCGLVVFPRWSESWGNCEVVIDCNETAIYRQAAHCPPKGPLRVEELEFSSEDGSPQLALDLGAGKATLKDRGEQASWSAELRVDP